MRTLRRIRMHVYFAIGLAMLFGGWVAHFLASVVSDMGMILVQLAWALDDAQEAK